ncbi:5'/3'-nucleotidase SurE [Saccharothrix luteola]|uniref:5'/3'-nucleotidase SurE n=1 Tax=Saccharothrix luteola TaxID=2893018 RepID=UPI001E597D61|nr:5'/3'-nucleotidase SurE [Saccharothrix luteola]MCC8243018.1 5'/3'-nucleotidase SurE [Saccharothrix luteola]
MRALITNDDGVAAPGLHALADALAAEFDDVVVVAPATDWSGAGTAINPGTRTGDLRPRVVELPGVSGVPAYAVAGPPALAVLVALTGVCGPRPDVVFSGINSGPNIGVGLLHSGTVGAALTAAIGGVPALAVSLDGHWHLGVDPNKEVRRRHWGTAVGVVVDFVPTLLSLDEPLVLNVNVPDVPSDRLRAVRDTAIAPVAVLDLVDHEGVALLDMRPGVDPPPGGQPTDAALLAAGHVTVTALRLARSLVPADFTDPRAAVVEAS